MTGAGHGTRFTEREDASTIRDNCTLANPFPVHKLQCSISSRALGSSQMGGTRHERDRDQTMPKVIFICPIHMVLQVDPNNGSTLDPSRTKTTVFHGTFPLGESRLGVSRKDARNLLRYRNSSAVVLPYLACFGLPMPTPQSATRLLSFFKTPCQGTRSSQPARWVCTTKSHVALATVTSREFKTQRTTHRKKSESHHFQICSTRFKHELTLSHASATICSASPTSSGGATTLKFTRKEPASSTP